MSKSSIIGSNRLAVVLPLLLLVLPGGCAEGGDREVFGAYRFDDGELVSVRRSKGAILRYRVFASGQSRRLFAKRELRYEIGPSFRGRSPAAGLVEFRRDESGGISGLTLRSPDGATREASRVGTDQAVTFTRAGTRFAARLQLPEGPGPHPAIALVHGSGTHPGTEFFFNGDFFAAHGIATLTYDKRGTGGSAGRHTFDFEVLARDAAAAVELLATRPEIDADRIGLAGYSQGGWVAPLAARISDRVSYVLVSYGLVGSPAEEARVETRNLVRGRGVDEDSLDQLDELTRAAVRVVASDFRDGWDELEAVERRYRSAAWTRQLGGTVVGKMISYPRWLVRLLGRRQSPVGLDWYYDSEALLADLEIPMVWFVAAEDSSAPPELTLPALERLAAAGKPYETIVFDGADHAMLRFDERDGERVHTGYAEDYFRAEVEAARRLSGLPPLRARAGG